MHHNFFYEFHESHSTVNAGLDVGNILRTDGYQSIGNFAAFLETPNYNDPTKMDKEILVWMNGKLEANYYNSMDGKIYSGTFTKQ